MTQIRFTPVAAALLLVMSIGAYQMTDWMGDIALSLVLGPVA